MSSSPDALLALAHYDLPAGCTTRLINISENETYRVDAPNGQSWALRVHRAGYHTKVAIASELAWLMDLRRSGVALTPRPVKGRDGKTIQIVPSSTMEQPRHVVLSEWEAGSEPNFADDLDAPFEKLGEIAARMHMHVRQWKKPEWFQRHSWDFENCLGDTAPLWGRWRDGMGVDAVKERLFARAVALIGKRLRAYGQGQERFGLIHGDLRLANLLIDGDAVKVLDFDDCGFGWNMYDAATTVSFYEHEPQVPHLIEAWKRGYRKVASLPKQDEEEIPTFLMLRRLLLVAWIGSHSETDLARSLGHSYTEGTARLCEDYLRKFG